MLPPQVGWVSQYGTRREALSPVRCLRNQLEPALVHEAAPRGRVGQDDSSHGLREVEEQRP